MNWEPLSQRRGLNALSHPPSDYPLIMPVFHTAVSALCFMFGQLLVIEATANMVVRWKRVRHDISLRALARKGIARVSLRVHVQQQGAHRHISFS